MVDAISNIYENRDLEHQQTVIKDTVGDVFLGGLLLQTSSPAGVVL